ncbi:MAG: signal recognition particle-docking protein FtsY [Anaerolineae bacterium]
MFGNKVQQSLTRSRHSYFGRIRGLLARGEVNEALWQELEELLIQADVGVETTVALIEGLRERVDKEGLREARAIREVLKGDLKRVVTLREGPRYQEDGLWVILVVGVNGSGKTTSIAKLARYHQGKGRKVLLAAADTFRAAAIDQLKIWGQRLGVDVVAHQPGGDPGAVVYDAIEAGQARDADLLIIDTAGRLHTKYNLMEELKKLRRVAAGRIPEAPQEVILVLDATTGQNALTQAKYFQAAVEVTGVFVAKLDGTAKGGIVFAIAKELGIPIQYVGTGERLEDLAEFDAEEFVEGLFAES